MSHTSMHNAEPSERRLTLNLTFHGVARQNEPLGESVAYRLDPVGFWDERSAGGAGEDPTPKNYETVARALAEHFDAAELRAVLSHLTALQKYIPA